MRIAVIVNHRSGRGRAARLLDEVLGVLRSRGDDAVSHRTDELFGRPDLDPFERADGAVIIGGDGTLHHSLDGLVRRGCPVYVVPAGTENLFARIWGMTRDASDLRRALESGRTSGCDVGRVNGRRFALMCGVGLDAEVIRRVATERRGNISKLTYMGPLVRAVVDYEPGKMRVKCDGRAVVDGKEGWVVISNARAYAARFDPALHARPDDGLLDVLFLPTSDGAETMAVMGAIAARRHLRFPGVVYTGAREVEVESLSRGAPVQADGELMPFSTPIAVSVEPSALRVLAAAPA